MNKTRNLIFLAAASVMLGYLLIVSPARDVLDEQEVREDELKMEFESKQRKLMNLDAFKQLFVELDEMHSELRQLLPLRIDTATEVQAIKQAAANYNVVVSAASFQKTRTREFYEETPFTLEASGEHADLFYFVYDTFYVPARAVQLHDFLIERANGTLSLELEGAYSTYLEYEL